MNYLSKTKRVLANDVDVLVRPRIQRQPSALEYWDRSGLVLKAALALSEGSTKITAWFTAKSSGGRGLHHELGGRL